MRHIRNLAFIFLCTAFVSMSSHPAEASPPRFPFDSRVTTDRSRGAQSLVFPIPSSGAQKLLVVLVDFSDEAGAFPQTDFATRFFGPLATGSFADYFREVSYGALNYSGDVVGVTGGAPVTNSSSIAYVRAPQPKTFYTNNESGVGTSSFPRNLNGLVRDVLIELDTKGFDFTPYANGTTKEVQNLVVVFTGRNSVDSNSTADFQPTSYSLTYDVSGGVVSTQGFVFKEFTFCNEKGTNGSIAEIAVCVHEHGHNLGLVDMYDINYRTAGVGYYDLMGYGLYGGSSEARPLHPGAYSKVALGWVRPRSARRGTTIYRLRSASRFKDVIKVSPLVSNTTEYFLLENRQRNGFDDGFTARGLCPGLFIWHVDEDIISTYLPSNLVNATGSPAPPHPGIKVVEADGNNALGTNPIANYGECGDRWRKGRMFSDSSRPKARLWSGRKSGVSVKVLSDRGGVVRVQVTRKRPR